MHNAFVNRPDQTTCRVGLCCIYLCTYPNIWLRMTISITTDDSTGLSAESITGGVLLIFSTVASPQIVTVLIAAVAHHMGVHDGKLA